MPDVHAALSDSSLVRAFGGKTVMRARGYLPGGVVRDVRVLESDETGMVVGALVSGTSAIPYRVHLTVEVYGGETEVWSDCSCPVGDLCKHGAATALVVRSSLEPVLTAASPQVPEWERRLTGALAELEAMGGPDREGTRRLALQIDVKLPSPRRLVSEGLDPLVYLRPLQAGAKQNWIKTGIKWSEVPAAALRAEHDPDQLDILAQLYALLVSRQHYWSVTDTAQLEDFGPGLWRLLSRARESGLVVVSSSSSEEVEVLDHPVEISLDVVGGETGADLVLGIHHGGELWSGARVMAVGRPVHGVVLIGDDGRLTLAGLSRTVPASLHQLLREDALHVPESSRADFEATYLPALRRQLAVGSSDGSVELPESPAPRLVLTVTWRSSLEAGLEWSWRYGSAESEVRCALDGEDRLGGLRDLRAERAVLAGLETDEALPVLEVTGRRPVARQVVTGEDTLLLDAEVLPRLRDGGVVEVVEVDRPDFREAQGPVEIRFDTEAATLPGPTDWLDLLVVLTVDGEQIPLPDVLAALTLGQDRIILPSGLHVAADRPELTALHELVRAAAELAEQSREGVRVGTHDLGLWAQLARMGIVDDQAAEWVRRAQALRDLDGLPTPEPTGVVSALRSYQLDGFHWLAFLWEAGLGGVLADDMGLGKTLQVLALVAHARSQGDAPFLVVAPTSVVSAWEGQAARHTPGLRVRTIISSARRRGRSVADLAADADIVVTTYTLLRLEIDDYLGVTWGGIVLDEAQQVKNHQGKTYQAVRRLDSRFKLAVTGTPFENRLMELWSLLSITTPGLYPWPAKFAQNVARPVEKEGDTRALRRFRERIRPFVLRRTKELVASDLPPKQEQVLEVRLDPKHRRIYDTHLQKERQKILGLVEEFEQNRVAIFSSLTKLRQLALDPGLVDPAHATVGSAKLDLLVEQLAEITAEGHRALVFSQFTSFLGRVRDRLAAEGIPTAYLDGRTRDRAAAIEEFTEGTAPVFLISLKAGGVGLTLTEADYVYVLDPWWNPAAEAQAVDRAHRIGQERPVMVYRLVSVDTIEEKVMALKARKAELFAQVIDGDGAMSSTIGADDIRALFDG